jgi:hypothetical protein
MTGILTYFEIQLVHCLKVLYLASLVFLSNKMQTFAVQACHVTIAKPKPALAAPVLKKTLKGQFHEIFHLNFSS